MSISRLSKLGNLWRDTTLTEEPATTHGKCSECNTWYKLDGLGGYWEYESWEMPQEYYVHYCPKCPDGGCIDDYAHEEDLTHLAEIMRPLQIPKSD